jgi:hypothetical protein
MVPHGLPKIARGRWPSQRNARQLASVEISTLEIVGEPPPFEEKVKPVPKITDLFSTHAAPHHRADTCRRARARRERRRRADAARLHPGLLHEFGADGNLTLERYEVMAASAARSPTRSITAAARADRRLASRSKRTRSRYATICCAKPGNGRPMAGTRKISCRNCRKGAGGVCAQPWWARSHRTITAGLPIRCRSITAARPAALVVVGAIGSSLQRRCGHRSS